MLGQLIKEPRAANPAAANATSFIQQKNGVKYRKKDQSEFCRTIGSWKNKLSAAAGVKRDNPDLKVLDVCHRIDWSHSRYCLAKRTIDNFQALRNRPDCPQELIDKLDDLYANDDTMTCDFQNFIQSIINWLKPENRFRLPPPEPVITGAPAVHGRAGSTSSLSSSTSALTQQWGVGVMGGLPSAVPALNLESAASRSHQKPVPSTFAGGSSLKEKPKLVPIATSGHKSGWSYSSTSSGTPSPSGMQRGPPAYGMRGLPLELMCIHTAGHKHLTPEIFRQARKHGGIIHAPPVDQQQGYGRVFAAIPEMSSAFLYHHVDKETMTRKSNTETDPKLPAPPVIDDPLFLAAAPRKVPTKDLPVLPLFLDPRGGQREGAETAPTAGSVQRGIKRSADGGDAPLPKAMKV
uniref:Uncharacterized protein n=1 Tax=Chromera velia CCMP2878 TaxID=1169474 RepID=A0A0G4GL91_9ALVE|mmetsp:Transcript_39440/g.77631  ORF Transcript_39440/g.77631 Transcript_39440/m.77631 type:complete len:406 (-) Transcript_39440:83-1300(-)|eukprot:Cvel_4866.t1-p1 / transcript=Cvel_4866.t1 / gene=Cvel_4866 / organism=Chromera_velia_CCMP2878 / gene_product=hypothetical protein / transcript_product=hypothetical protein / location=Cvel_scaffold219:93530-96628(-) / protein_length=405 / sequence_SO=supercontig / SO=protein_coding / is_pseudo=false